MAILLLSFSIFSLTLYKLFIFIEFVTLTNIRIGIFCHR